MSRLLSSFSSPYEAVTVVFDLRYVDWELFESSRDAFIAVVGDMIAISRAAALLKGSAEEGEAKTQCLEVFATDGNRLVSVWSSRRDASDATEALRHLSSFTPVRSPPRETDKQVMSVLLQQQHCPASGQRLLVFFTSFTTINDFGRHIHSAKLLTIPFMDDTWVSIHLDATALSTTVLPLTPAIRSVRCPISPLCIRGALQRVLMLPLQLQECVPISLRFGRYTVSCTAHRTFFVLPTRCCVAEDFDVVQECEQNGDTGDSRALMLCGRRFWTSHFERKRRIAKEVVLTVDGIVGGEAVSEDMLYGDGWLLLAKESLDLHGPTPDGWLQHLSREIQGDVLLLTTQQPLLDPPHQLALPCSKFVAFFLHPTRLYLRAVIPPELRVEHVDAVASCATVTATRLRLDPMLSEELKKTADALRANSSANLVEMKRPVGVSHMLAQLQQEQCFSLQLERRETTAAPRRGGVYSLHNHH